MKFSMRVSLKAIAVVTMAMAFFLSGCQPKKILDIFPKRAKPPDTFLQAESDYHAGDYESALKGYLRYLEKHPKGKNARLALFRATQIYHSEGRYRASLPLLRQIITEYPDHPETPLITFQLAETLFRLGDYKQAEDEATEWTRQFPEHPLRGDVFLLLVKCLSAQGSWIKAFSRALKSSEMFDDDPVKYSEIEKWIQGLIKKVDVAALKEMSEFAAGGPFAPPIFHRLALIYLQEHHLEDAKKAAMSLIRSTPEQYWVQQGRQILDQIEQELSVQVGAVACLLPLSGPFAIYGQEVLNGIQLGMGIFEDDDLGKTIELIIRDTEGEPVRAAQIVKNLALEGKTMAIVGPLASKTAMASAKKAQELGIPIITLTQKTGITDIGNMVFRHFLIPHREVHKIIEKTMGEMGFNRFGILYPNNSYGRFFMNLFWDQVEERGGRITAIEHYRPEQTDCFGK
ncbi:MAG: penicillin-binding protein activator [Deltaproteobacteria bacterium]|nr:penicillin-binding protein activator [Deltaproteobacteria bacterium]